MWPVVFLPNNSLKNNGQYFGKLVYLKEIQFYKRIQVFVKNLPKTPGNIEDGKQVIRASGSVGADYIEANEALGKKDFLMRTKISRKGAEENAYLQGYDRRLFFRKLGKSLDNTKQIYDISF